MNNTPFYITTTLPYVNAPLHMGHALEFVRTDVIARYKKLQGFDVFFNTGTDEHGQKIYTKAQEAGKDPQSFVDANFEVFKTQVAAFGIDPDAHFVRTTDEHHIKAAQEFWNRVNANGYIYKKIYQAKYCVGCEEVKTDSDLVHGECPLHPGTKLELIDEENYFFKLSALQDKLLALYASRQDFVVPAFRFNEVKAFVERGLEDFSISRLKEKMAWGIPVPGDDTHVMYVWFDALTNYISTLGWPEQTDQFERYWVNGTPTQYCGKDNTRFQSLTWQAMLLAAGVPNSHQIVVNGFITGEGGVRMSKTLGNVVDPLAIADEYGTDALRFFLLKEISSFEDSPFTIERFREAYNAHLANGLGNLVSRIMTMAENNKVSLSDEELKMTFFNEKNENLENFEINKFVDQVFNFDVKTLDAYIQREEPFKKIKIDEIAGKNDMHYLLIHLYAIGLKLAPILPKTSDQIIEIIKSGKKPENPLFQRL